MLTILSVLALPALPSLITGLSLQHIDGDLTRLGYYSENDFGWNKKQYRYSPALSEKGKLGNQYDIVIIGDSFSASPSPSQVIDGRSYSNYLANDTGLRVGIFHVDDQPVPELLLALANQSKPPIAIVYQTVERAMKYRLRWNTNCPLELNKVRRESIQPGRTIHTYEPVPVWRDTSLGLLDFRYTSKYLFAYLTNHRFNKRVIKARLSRNDLFSNSKSGHILLLSDDERKFSWSRQDWESMKCTILNMQNMVQKNGKSSFIFMVAPDKSSVYAPFISDRQMPSSHLSNLESEDLNFLRLDSVLTEHARTGTVDVYLPNNTHWSYEGHLIVAKELIAYLKARNIVNIVNTVD